MGGVLYMLYRFLHFWMEANRQFWRWVSKGEREVVRPNEQYIWECCKTLCRNKGLFKITHQYRQHQWPPQNYLQPLLFQLVQLPRLVRWLTQCTLKLSSSPTTTEWTGFRTLVDPEEEICRTLRIPPPLRLYLSLGNMISVVECIVWRGHGTKAEDVTYHRCDNTPCTSIQRILHLPRQAVTSRTYTPSRRNPNKWTWKRSVLVRRRAFDGCNGLCCTRM